MFKVNPDNMRMEPTPERVFSICRMVANKSITHEELKSLMTLEKEGDKELDQVNKAVKVALEELQLIDMKNDRLEYIGDSQILKTPQNFRRYVSSRVFLKKDTTFVMFSRWVISQNEKLFTLKNWEVMAKTCGAEVSELSALNENAVLGWRFWAAFLGLGYLSGKTIIPNLKIRLEDILATNFADEFKYGEAIRGTNFIEWLQAKMPEVDMNGRLPLALSAALRTLHELDLIKLETRMDSNRIMLYYVDGAPFNEYSHITVREEIRG